MPVCRICVLCEQELRDESFAKVERLFMMGLRSINPQTRQQFFSLYDGHIPPTLFDRLQFILMTHDWEAMAGQFWLKQALVRGGERGGDACCPRSPNLHCMAEPTLDPHWVLALVLAVWLNPHWTHTGS